MHWREASQRKPGFTLVEVMIAVSVLAFIVAALTQAIVAGQTQTYAALHENRAVSVGEALVERIIVLAYHDPEGVAIPGPEPDELLFADYDCIDDYHGYSEAAGALIDHADNPLPDAYQTFSRDVTVTYDTMNIPEFGGAQDGMTVTVNVTDENNRIWSISRWVPEPAS